MRRYYVNISGVATNSLLMCGYVVIAEDDDFLILQHKSETYIVEKDHPYLYVDDINDAELLNGIFSKLNKIEAPK